MQKKKSLRQRFSWRDFFVLIPICFYFFTMAPGIGMGDTGLSIENIQEFKINSHVNNHNVMIIVGKLLSFLPSENIAWKANLISVLTGSAAVIAFYFLIRRVFDSRVTAFVSALVLMVSHSMWWHSTTVECYAINALFTIIAIFLLQKLQEKNSLQTLTVLFFVSGLAFFNHVQMGFVLSGAGIFFLIDVFTKLRSKKSRQAIQLLGFCTLSFLLGFAPFLLILIKDMILTGQPLEMIRLAFGGDFQSIMFQGDTAWLLRDLASLMFNNFPSFFLALIPVGFVMWWRQWHWSKSFWALFTMFLVNTSFFLFYTTWDKFAFLLPSFVIAAFWGSFAVDALRALFIKRGILLRIFLLLLAAFLVLFPIYWYAHFATWAQDPDSRWYADWNNNYTENSHNLTEYLANPNKRHYTDFEDFANVLFATLPPEAIYIDDDSRNFFSIDYFQKYYNARPDIDLRMINSWGFDNWGLGHEQFTDLLGYAYEADKPLFIISLKAPFWSFIESSNRRNDFAFTKFSLDEERWIYKLVTASEDAASQKSHSLAIDLDEHASLDLNTAMLAYIRGVYPHDQNMLFFGDDWRNNHQLFIGADQAGGEISLLLYSEHPKEVQAQIAFTAAPDFGIVDIFLNEENVAGSFDLFAENVTVRDLELPDLLLRSGLNEIRFTITDKNPRSENYKMGIDFIDFEVLEASKER